MRRLLRFFTADSEQLAAYARPHDPADYERPELDGSGPTTTDIPLDGTKPDASWDVWPPRTLENGVDDSAGIGGRRIRVAASFEDGVHKLRPFGKKIVAVTRRLDGDELLWRYGFGRNRLRRLDGPPLDHPATRAAAEAAQEET